MLPLTVPRIVTPGLPTGVAVADVDGDGKPDLVVTLQGVPGDPGPQAVLEVRLGNGDGTFQPGQQTVIDSGGPFAPAIADIDGDGDLDVVIALSERDASAVQLVLGDGHGHFTAGDRLAGSFVSAVALADLDGDGRIDIVTASANVTSGVAIRFGTGGGRFAAPIALEDGTAYDSVVIRDVDDDHVLDVVAAGDSLGVFRGLGNRAFEAPFKTALGGDFAHDVAVADLNGDGIPDLATAGLASVDELLVVETWLGSGTGTFARRDELRRFPDHHSDFQRSEIVVSAVDLFTREASITVLNNDGTGAFSAGASIAEGGLLLLLDLDGDGRLDLVTYGSTPSIRVRLGKGDRTFDAPIDTDLGAVLSRLVVADLNGDGVPDLAAETAGANVRTLLLTGNGNGTFASAGTLPAAPGGLLALADLDSMPPLDLVGRLGVIYRAGSELRTDDWPMLALDVRDLTGDGHLDVVGVGYSVLVGPRSNAVFAIASQCQ